MKKITGMAAAACLALAAGILGIANTANAATVTTQATVFTCTATSPVLTGTPVPPKGTAVTLSTVTGTYYATGETSSTFELASSKNGAALDGAALVPASAATEAPPAPCTATATWAKPVHPYVFDGHVVSATEHTAVVGWSDSTAGWPSSNHCVQVLIYGFDKPAGTAHVGFTCDNGDRANDLGYLDNLTPGHEVALQVVPAVGVYGNNHPIAGTDKNAHIDVTTVS